MSDTTWRVAGLPPEVTLTLDGRAPFSTVELVEKVAAEHGLTLERVTSPKLAPDAWTQKLREEIEERLGTMVDITQDPEEVTAYVRRLAERMEEELEE
jgi:hypothetical protein